MGTSHLMKVALFVYITLQTTKCQDEQCTDNGTLSIDLTSNNSFVSIPTPCRNTTYRNDNSAWFLKLRFTPYPFDCSTGYVKYRVPSPGVRAAKFCRKGSETITSQNLDPDSEINTLNENNETSVKFEGSNLFTATLRYFPQGASNNDLRSISVAYQFLYCLHGILNDSLVCKELTTTTLSTTATTITPTSQASSSSSVVTTTTATPRTTTTFTSTTTTKTTTTQTTKTSTSATTRATTRVNDGTFCAAENDPYPESHIKWEATSIDHTDEKPCPFNAKGTATRKCIDNSTDTEPHAVWLLPDLTNCISPFFKESLDAANNLLEQENVKPSSIIGVTSGLTNATKASNEVTIFPGDLSAAAETVGIMAEVVGKVEAGREDLYQITKGCSEVMSNIIDTSTDTIWKFTKNGYLENRVTSILNSMERLSTNIARRSSKLLVSRAKREVDDDMKYENTTVTTRNLALSIDIVDRATNFTSYSDIHSELYGDGGITLPSDVFIKAVQGTSDPYIHLYYARFSSIADLLTSTNSKVNGPRNTYDSYITSDIFSSKVLNVEENSFHHLKNAVKIVFTTKNTSLGVLMPKCVFLNMTARTNEDRWSSKGCVRSPRESNDNTTVCYCNHLTNFAVLMDIYDIENYIDDFDAKILTYLSYGGGALSILGCCISIVVFEIFRLKNQRVRVHEQLAITIIFVQLFFMVGIDRTENKYVCKVLAICLHYMLVAMFCWMLVEGAHLYLVLVKVFKSRSHMKKYIVIGWGVPLIIVGISAGIFHEDYGTGPVCWITHKVLLVAFVPAISLVIVINTVVLIVVMRIMFNSMSKGSKSAVEERSSVKSGLKAACVLLPLLGLTWIFGYLSITSRETLIFTYLFTFFNSMQGVFFFVFHCLLSVDVQNAYERHHRRRSQIRLTESSFSKRIRKGSEFESSEYSPGSRESIRTDLTSAHSTLDKRIANQIRHHNVTSRPHSVSFDDDVFVTPGDVINERLHRKSSNGSSKDSNIGHETPRRRLSSSGSVSYNTDGRPNGQVMNNVIRGSRHNSETSDGYVLYYGSSTPVQKNDIQRYSSFDKNDLYATVQK